MKGLRRVLSVILFITISTGIVYSQKLTRQQYINKYKDVAVKQMKKHKIPASIILAQACLESGDGNSTLATKANNHFGIKCHDGWKGRRFKHDDDAKNECFRRYDNAYDSFTDHSYFLTSRSRYASLFDIPVGDYKSWAYGLKAAGYATNPKYAQLLIDIIEEYELYKYDGLDAVKISKKSVKEEKRIKKLEKKAQKANKKVEKANKKAAKAQQRLLEQKGEDIPAIPAGQVQSPATGGQGRTHTVRAGDTLYSIARKNGISVEQIYKLNNGIKADSLSIGTVLKLD